ncbi:hypothetical protein F1B92_04550 [Campylobacter sp. FMV-PI01]|uniref:Uncharacterized protein n=1 Tax=Campylobacter portucalensis TaxID=2608384 RepID=A0A6L5WGY1_9BACT|nr:hypothetical protein [Campylobacter portucalensis]MSN96450.1 hypothetical protein [Campylobacter portucalensis]
MTLYEFRKQYNITVKDLSETLGVTENYIKNKGSKDIKDLSFQIQANIKLFEENRELKNNNKVLKNLLKGDKSPLNLF